MFAFFFWNRNDSKNKQNTSVIYTFVRRGQRKRIQNALTALEPWKFAYNHNLAAAPMIKAGSAHSQLIVVQSVINQML